MARSPKMPQNVEAERYVLGSILLDNARYIEAAGLLKPDDFNLEKHRHIFRAMGALHDRGQPIDRVTLAHELDRAGELESCDGIGYVVSLDDGLPEILNLDAYIRIVRDKSGLRKIVFTSQHLMNRAMAGAEGSAEILSAAERSLLDLGAAQLGPRSESGSDLLRKVKTEAMDRKRRWESGEKIMGIESGLPQLDEILNGFNPGLYVLGGGPGAGKTTICTQFSLHACSKGTPVVYVSYENSAENLMLKATCARAGVNPRSIERGSSHTSDFEKYMTAAEQLEPVVPFLEIIEGTSGLPLAAVQSKAMDVMRRQKASRCLVVFDFLQRAAAAGQKDMTQNVSELAGRLSDLAKRLRSPVLAISSQNREHGDYGSGKGSAVLSSFKKCPLFPDCSGFFWVRENLVNHAKSALSSIVSAKRTKSRPGWRSHDYCGLQTRGG